MKKHTLLVCFLCCASFLFAQNGSLDMSGSWQFRIDPQDVGEQQGWINQAFEDTIELPGSMPQRLKGNEVTADTRWTGSLYDSSYYYNPRMEPFRRAGNVKFPFFLTPDRHYVGVAWYQREVTLAALRNGERMVLFLERPHTESTLWINGHKVATQNSLCVPHEFDVTAFMKKGGNRIVLKIDNRVKAINVGPDSHSITDQTQGNWNGVVGRMELLTMPATHIDDLQVYPDIHSRTATVKVKVAGKANDKINLALAAAAFNTNKPHQPKPVSREFTLSAATDSFEIVLPMGDEVQLWDEFDPALYRLTATLTSGKKQDTRIVQFGMREFRIEGKWFYVNGRKTMLRGTVENCCFPLTGYAPMDEASWERVFRICRDFGLNHMRFHSFCPPEAAFAAADKVGFYLQPEGPSWPNHGPKLGLGQPIDTYLMEETVRLNRTYGNYASFCMLACGNEPAGRWVPWVSDFVDYWKKTDPRHVYTGASVGGSWAWQPKNQYHVKAGARGVNWATTRPESLSDFRERIDTVSQPYVSHETGQWCAFPDFTEIRKYTGVNKARNFEIFKTFLAEGDMADLSHEFMMASGKLQALCYKHEIEKTLRTPDYAGFQLLSLNDYSGQGTALVGILNVFWEEKGYIDATAFRRFCNSTVPLARMPKFVYTNAETLEAAIEVSHFGKQPLSNPRLSYRIRDAHGALLTSGTLSPESIAVGSNNACGTVKYALNNVAKASKLNLEVGIEGTPYLNDWDFYVYPAQVNVAKGRVYETDTLDQKALAILQQGGDVLIHAAGRISYGSDIKQYFTPVFWNTSWFKMRPPHTTGIWLNNYHPVFADFPTASHSDLQWWELLNRTQCMQFTDFPQGFQPLVQSIDTWFISRKAGVLFEANVLNGRLIMTTLDLQSEPDTRVAARQLYASVLNYMNSDAFRPAFRVTPETVGDLFTRVADKINAFTKDAPDEIKQAQKKKSNNK